LQLCDVRSRCASPPYSIDAHAAPSLGQIAKIDDMFDAVGLGNTRCSRSPLASGCLCRIQIEGELHTWAGIELGDVLRADERTPCCMNWTVYGASARIALFGSRRFTR